MPKLYLALLEAGGLYVDGREEVLEEGSGQLQMFLTTKAVHHHQRSVLQPSNRMLCAQTISQMSRKVMTEPSFVCFRECKRLEL